MAMATLLLPGGCKGSQTCGSISGATRVVVHDSSARGNDRVLTDGEQIRLLTSFANARRACEKPLTTMPATRLSVTFYDKDEYLGSIGSGLTNSFLVGCQGLNGTRNATDAELSEFQRLIVGAP